MKPLVWIETPIRGFKRGDKLSDGFSACTMPVASNPDLPWRFELQVIGGGGVAVARNRVCADFLGSDAEWLFFQDYDLRPNPDGSDHIKILSRNLAICGGCYCTREENTHWVMNPLAGAVIQPTGLLQVIEIGTGFKLFHRSVFEKAIEKNPWLQYESDMNHKQEYAFFSMTVVEEFGKRRWLTEDFWFDALCRSIGIPVVADTTVRLKHEDDDGKLYPIEEPPIPVVSFACDLEKLAP